MVECLETKAESLEKLDHNLASETTKKTELLTAHSSRVHSLYIQVLNYPLDICKFRALFPDFNYNNFKG